MLDFEQRTTVDALGEHIENHSVDKEKASIGKKELLLRMKGKSFGCADVEITRPTPSINIDEISLDPGVSKVLIGPNGSGKSTIFDAIMGLQNNDAFFDTHDGDGAVSYGRSVHAGREGLRISRLNQEEMLKDIKNMKVADVLNRAKEHYQSEFPTNWEDMDLYDQNLENEAAQQRISELSNKIMGLFNIDEFVDRKVGQLSGGEKTKLTIFMVLMSEPDIMLLDEPTNHLDLESIAKLSTLFEIYKEAGVSILSVSHVDWYLEESGKDGVLEIEFTDNARQVKSTKSDYRRHMKDRNRQEFTVISDSLQWKNYESLRQGTYLTTVDTQVTVPDSPLVDFELDSLKAGEVWVLSGNNGTGKTKLMEAMVSREGRKGIFRKEKGVNIAYLPQFWPAEVANGTLEKFFQHVKDEINPKSEIVSKSFVNAIRKIGFLQAGETNTSINRRWMNRKLKSFSGGEQRLLWFLAVSCFDDVDCLLLDEPTNHMDKNLQEFVVKAVRDFPGAVVFSTHDISLLEQISQDIGEKVGGNVKAKNIVLEKIEGQTIVESTDESPIEYTKSVLEKAKKEAKKFKV